MLRFNVLTSHICMEAASRYHLRAVSSSTRNVASICDHFRFCKRVCKIAKSGIVSRQDTVDCTRFRIRASVPWRASLSVPCRIGHAPARVDDSLDVIDYLREVCNDSLIEIHILAPFCKDTISFLNPASISRKNGRDRGISRPYTISFKFPVQYHADSSPNSCKDEIKAVLLH